jgi:hypothetical protein
MSRYDPFIAGSGLVEAGGKAMDQRSTRQPTSTRKTTTALAGRCSAMLVTRREYALA